MDRRTQATLEYFRLSENTEVLRRVFTQGDLFQAIALGNWHAPPPSKPNRCIKEFSAQARLRLLKYSATIDWPNTGNSLYSTFTYPPENEPKSRKELNQHRFLLHRRCEAILGKSIGAIWRIEWKPRLSGSTKGALAPHYHLIMFNVGYFPYKELRLGWKTAIGAKREVSMRFDPLLNGSKAAHYIAKYTAKLQPACNLDILPHLNKLGRHYGFLRKALIPLRERVWYQELSTEQYQSLLSFAGEQFDWLDQRCHKSFCLLGGFGKSALVRILEMGLATVQSDS